MVHKGYKLDASHKRKCEAQQKVERNRKEKNGNKNYIHRKMEETKEVIDFRSISWHHTSDQILGIDLKSSAFSESEQSKRPPNHQTFAINFRK